VPRKPPPIPAKGTRHPGAGRVKGNPNRISVEVKTLVSELVNSATYQHKLRADFVRRKVHPTIESLIWAYYLGKPRQPVDVNATVDVTARLEEEKRIFATLDIRELEELAAESQRLVDRALALSRARVGTLTPQDVVAGEDLPKDSAETLAKEAGSDKGYSVDLAQPAEDNAISPDDTAG
jgi:hypothetical protein